MVMNRGATGWEPPNLLGLAKTSPPPLPLPTVVLGGKREGEGVWILMSLALPHTPATWGSFPFWKENDLFISTNRSHIWKWSR